MPSKKPQFVIRTEQDILDKIAYIAEQNERSSTQEIVFLIKQHIKAYEAEHGEIHLPTKSDLKYGDIVTEDRIDELYADYDMYQPKLTRDMFKTCLSKCTKKNSKGVAVDILKLNRLIKDMCGY